LNPETWSGSSSIQRRDQLSMVAELFDLQGEEQWF
jgi:hypothetical protein